ncbi:energy transducer TonB [Mucilaginibacter polytrichastri]|uniref:TonB C-terminal domain-containing protein n=1 Tax=Mucilaginibacter polytrichastri TaxID=1302689 RepID=A0A1Q5ZTI7_9SPHI|nr:energy transducer TonB [Mucilaginibacter polytrichastri]OKS85085.1 hypothetical protein RG47T_0524 [Mucilaginibacter polytrichastri]SFS44741.1 TonB protein C-terminal [Mucilaginibacter polytrichastri]
MKFFYLICFVILSNAVFAQINKSNIYGTWVINKITFRDDAELPDEHVLKNVYLKYTFSQPNKLNTSTLYYNKGDEISFDINDGFLLFKTPEGNLMNTFHIETVNKNELVLLQKGREGFDDPDALKFYFIPEEKYQANFKLRPSDIYSIKLIDTIYNSSPKIYPIYKGISFQSYLSNGIHERISMDNREGHLAASFIVTKAGIADSVKIIEGIDDEFNRRFIKIFNQARKDWKPAILNGNPVSALMMVNLRYTTSDIMMPAYFATRKANDAFNAKEYAIALYYYDISLERTPFDVDNLYRRGMCKMLLGNIPWACEDWKKAKALGGNSSIDAAIEKYCN